MVTFEFTSPDGQTFQVEGPDGATEAEAFAILQQQQGAPAAPAAPAAVAPEVPLADAVVPEVGPVGSGLENNIPAELVDSLGDRTINGRTIGEDALRGLGLSARTLTGALPRTATGLTDLAATVLNVIPAGIDKLGQAIGDEPMTARLPTDSTAQLDALLDEIFPSPEGVGERMVGDIGEMVLTGGAGGAALAPKIAGVSKAPEAQSIMRNLGDEIGEFFAASPSKFAALEATGATGAATGAELAESADLGPGGRALATIVGGIGGGLAPQGAVNLGRRAGAAVRNKVPGFGADVRAAKALQGDVADPAAAGRAALDAPEGATPAQAADSPMLRAKENRVLEDDPAVASQVEAGREAAQARTLDELATQFGPGTDRRAWEQSVVSQAAPDGADIPLGEVDDMVRSAESAFGAAYRDAEGYPILNREVRVEGGDRSMPEELAEAVLDSAVLTGDNVRNRVASWLDGRYNSLVNRGDNVGGSPDDPRIQVDSADMLELRHIVRMEQRQKASAGLTDADTRAEAALLNNADRAITRVLESQLPPDVVAALRATDARYADFKTVQGAVARSGDKGLTPQALRSAINRSRTPGQVARGDTGRVGALAEQGADPADLLKPSATEAQARRLVRDMTPEQRQAVKSDLNAEMSSRASQKGKTEIDGAKYLKEIDANEAQLRAAGFDDTDLKNMRRIGSELKMIQSRSAAKVKNLLEDNVNVVFRLVGAIAGSASGSRMLRMLGVKGSGPSLILSQFGSREMNKTLRNLTVDKADELVREAMTNRELFNALMTKPTDSVKVQADNARVINAWIAEAGKNDAEAE